MQGNVGPALRIVNHSQHEDSAVRLMGLALTSHAKKWSFVHGWRYALKRIQDPEAPADAKAGEELNDGDHLGASVHTAPS